jgi:hypothetical protein
MGRPALERHEERVLYRLLSAIEVAEDAGENRDRLPRLAPEQAVQVGVPRAGQDAVASVAEASPPGISS